MATTTTTTTTATTTTKHSISIANKSEGIVTIILEHKQSEFQILINGVYLPPLNSPYGKDPGKCFDTLLTTAYSYEPNLRLSIGDFNARVGDLDDTIDGEIELPKRHVIDKTINSHGQQLKY